MRYAIVEATVPSSTGTVDYTAANITSWSSGGLAIVFVTGDTADPGFGAFLSAGLVDSGGLQFVTGYHSQDASTSVPINKEVHGDDCAVYLMTVAGGLGVASARAAFSAALTNGVRLNWNITSGVGGRTFKIIVVLIDGLTSVAASSTASLSPGFQTDGAILLPAGNSTYGTTGDGSGAATVTVVCTGLGGVVRDGSLTQKSSYCFSDDALEPVRSRGGRRTTAWSVASAGTTEDIGTITAIGATTLTQSGASRGIYASMKSAVTDYAVALESLDGTTGSKVFTGLGFRSGLIIGFIDGSTADNTFETDNLTFSRFAYFVTDGTTTISFGFAQRHTGTNITAANPTDTYSSYANGSILVVDHLNATDFAATLTSIDATGLTLNVTDGMSGTMMLFGFLLDNPAPRVISETEELSDTPIVFLNRSLALSETEEISDQFASASTTMDSEGLEAGTSFDAHAERGASFSAGAEAGTTE